MALLPVMANIYTSNPLPNTNAKRNAAKQVKMEANAPPERFGERDRTRMAFGGILLMQSAHSQASARLVISGVTLS